MQKQEEHQKILHLLDNKLKSSEDEKKVLIDQVEKTKLSNQTIAKELIGVNGEAAAAVNELKSARKDL